MHVVVVAEAGGAGRLQVLDDGGEPTGTAEHTADLCGRMATLEAAHRPRWVLPSAAELYPELLRAGVRLNRAHDLSLAEGILLGDSGRHHSPRGLAAAWARHAGLPEPQDRPPPRRDEHPALFEAEPGALPGNADPLHAAIAVHADQRERIAATAHADRMNVLVAAESAGALAAAEMSHHGLPWRVDTHDALLTELLGPRPSPGARPAKLTELAEEVAAAFGGRQVNPDHPPSVVRAFAREGIDIESSRAWVLKQIEHPAIGPLLEYKELSRLYAAHGWSWLQTWVRDGRFRPEYVVGGVVSGRWASRGGAALQLPKALRAAARADPGWRLVVADAAQLEPRVLAALSDDRRLAEVAGDTDLYASLAEDAFDGDRARAKIAMLSAMYGGTGGEAGSLLAVLRRRFPAAVQYVEAAARTGEQGGIVRSRLGRTSPAPSASRQELMDGAEDADAAHERRSRQASREWGRFTRNFVVQASAADWALALLAILRRKLAAQVPAAQLVFFVHDEVLVHCPESIAETVRELVGESAVEATAVVFGSTPVRFPLTSTAVECYADAK